MFKFFDFLVTLIQSVVNFIVSAVEMIIQVFLYIGLGIQYLITSVALLPDFAKIPIIAIISYIVIVTIINKGE